MSPVETISHYQALMPMREARPPLNPNPVGHFPCMYCRFGKEGQSYPSGWFLWGNVSFLHHFSLALVPSSTILLECTKMNEVCCVVEPGWAAYNPLVFIEKLILRLDSSLISEDLVAASIMAPAHVIVIGAGVGGLVLGIGIFPQLKQCSGF